MEMGLGLRTCFALETRKPIFINFKLSALEVAKVQKSLPTGFKLRPIKFTDKDLTAEYWISYNLYEILYPKKELRHIVKTRCEINTFVETPLGLKGIYVFCDSPYVSRETESTPLGRICDFAERLVIFIYGVGRAIRLTYQLSAENLRVSFASGTNEIELLHHFSETEKTPSEALSPDYWAFNNISIFKQGQIFDQVYVNSDFYAARFQRVAGNALQKFSMRGIHFNRKPDEVYAHGGPITYLVNAMNLAKGQL